MSLAYSRAKSEQIFVYQRINLEFRTSKFLFKTVRGMCEETEIEYVSSWRGRAVCFSSHRGLTGHSGKGCGRKEQGGVGQEYGWSKGT